MRVNSTVDMTPMVVNNQKWVNFKCKQFHYRMGGILGKEGSPAKKRWGKLANALITKTKEPEEQNQQLHDKNHGQARQSFRFVI